MKTINILSVFVFLSIIYLGANGCNNNPVSYTSTQYKTFSEPEFADPNLRAEHGSLIIVDLEHLNSPSRPGLFDTETTGIDAIPVRYIETSERTFRLDESAKFEMKMVKDPSKEEVFLLTPANPEITINIPAGDYTLLFKSLKTYGSDSTTTQTVFFRPNELRPGSTGSTTLEQLAASNRCDSCVFNNLNLENVTIENVSLINSIFNNANITNCIFRNINLSRASINNSIFNETQYVNVNLSWSNINLSTFKASPNLILDQTIDFSNANLKRNTMTNITFLGTKLINAVMSGSNFQHSAFYTADISGSKFNGADISYATIMNAKAYGTDFCDVICYNVTVRNVSINRDTKCFIW